MKAQAVNTHSLSETMKWPTAMEKYFPLYDVHELHVKCVFSRYSLSLKQFGLSVLLGKIIQSGSLNITGITTNFSVTQNVVRAIT